MMPPRNTGMAIAWGSAAVFGIAMVGWFADAGAGPGPDKSREDADMKTTIWEIDNLKSIGGLETRVEGAPKVIETDKGNAVAFNGQSDGLFLEGNPVAGLPAFTLEVLFRPDADGAKEQRFFHIQETTGENRILLETRLPGDGKWYGDTYIQSGRNSKALNDPKRTHPTGQWHVLALVYDGQQMVQYVDGVRELAGKVAMVPMGPGRTSLGVRINKVHWFKGAVRRVRITSAALAPENLMKP